MKTNDAITRQLNFYTLQRSVRISCVVSAEHVRAPKGMCFFWTVELSTWSARATHGPRTDTARITCAARRTWGNGMSKSIENVDVLKLCLIKKRKKTFEA